MKTGKKTQVKAFPEVLVLRRRRRLCKGKDEHALYRGVSGLQWEISTDLSLHVFTYYERPSFKPVFSLV